MPDTITSQNRQRKREVLKPGSFTDRYIKSLKPDKERLLKKKQPAAKGTGGRKSVKGSTGELKK